MVNALRSKSHVEIDAEPASPAALRAPNIELEYGVSEFCDFKSGYNVIEGG
jgi:hypothetical protein